MAKYGIRVVNSGGIMDLEAVSDALRSKVGNLLTDANSLRKIIVQEVPEIQNPVQNVRFSTVANQLHLKIRGVGQQSETERLQRGEIDGW